MALKPLAVAALIAAATIPLVAQEASWEFSIGFRGTLTTSAKLFYLPEDSSEIVRSRYETLKNVLGAGLEMRIRPPGSSIFFSLSGEYQRKTLEQQQLLGFTTPPSVLPTESGYWMIPIEATINVDVPLGSDRFGLVMGAGAGIYYAERLLSVVGVPAVAENVRPAFGLHIRTSAEYLITNWMTVMAELRFRNPQITTTNRFQELSRTVGDDLVEFPQDEIPGRLDVDGMIVALGIVFRLQ